MSFWPKDAPDYKWPDRLMSHWMIPVRWSLAGLFHGACLAGRLMRPMQRKLPPVVVLRTDGIGDTLLFEPAIESLARIVSPREVHFWGPKPACDLLRECPAVRRRVTIPKGFKSGNVRYFLNPLWRMKMGFLIGFSDFECI